MEEPNGIQTASSAPIALVDFETAMNNLEAVVSELDGEVKLEQALHLFEQRRLRHSLSKLSRRRHQPT